MRIRVWNAFASNNSGSYTLVGSFRSAEEAAAAGAAFRQLIEEQQAWMESDEPSADATSPVTRFATVHGLASAADSNDEAWPQYGEPPEVEVIDSQILLHAPYTVTMPRAFGEYLFRHGGRVAAELDHAHHPIVVMFGFWMPDMWSHQAPWRARRRALVEAIEGGALEGSSVQVQHIDPDGDGALRLACTFESLLGGVRHVRALARSHGLSLSIDIFEAPLAERPLAAFSKR